MLVSRPKVTKAYIKVVQDESKESFQCFAKNSEGRSEGHVATSYLPFGFILRAPSWGVGPFSAPLSLVSNETRTML